MDVALLEAISQEIMQLWSGAQPGMTLKEWAGAQLGKVEKCPGYPQCDGDLTGESHEADCPSAPPTEGN